VSRAEAGGDAPRDVPGIHRANVERFFRDHVPGGDCALEFRQISGGRSNVTYLVSGGGREWVLRRPPLGHVLPTAHDMAREFRVLSALADTAVPVPRPFALCEDRAVNEQPFYVMQYTPGVVLGHDAPPPGFAEKPDDCRRISRALVATLVALHAVDWRAVGLEGFGRPEGYLERQVARWSKQWQGNVTEPLPEIDELIRRLGRAIPESPAPTIVHGDYRLGNLALDPADPGRIVAVFDWEMATLGDPLADLGYTLIYWTEAGDLEPGRTGALADLSAITARPGFFTRAELVEAYAKQSGRDVRSIDFYQVLALYKLAVISEGIYKRMLMGQTLGSGFKGMPRSAPALARRALAIADASGDARLRG
jgi:aminoglycoside phosphotransferase (APT) family kinase protein